jgi:hypothetical protein
VNVWTRRSVPGYWFESRKRYFWKNHGTATLAVANLLFAIGYATFRVRRRIQGKPDLDPPNLLADFVRHNALFASGNEASLVAPAVES